jgi:hypothetical protein
MQEHLLRTLIGKNFVKVATEVDAQYKGRDLCGVPIHTFEQTYSVGGLFESQKSGRLVLELRSTKDGSAIRVFSEAITKIDGMTPERFAENYLVAPDGSDIKVEGKRRGRRPKNWNPETDA